MTTRLATVIVLITAVSCFAACGGSSNYQPPATTVSGTVTHGDQFTKVTFDPTAGSPTVFKCASDGTYEGSLAAGTYATTASRPGYEDDGASGIVIDPGPNTDIDFTLTALGDNEYISSESCAVCHQSYYDTFRNTGHPYKINKVVGGVAPTYPFTTLPGDLLSRLVDDGADIGGGATDPNGTETDNPEGTPSGWGDVSYVIGGYFWKARFIDQSGWIVTGTEVQYNYQNPYMTSDTMTAYHNNEGYLVPPGPDDKAPKPFNCGNCHTTGWQHFDATVNNKRQDGLAGMDGTFHKGGIQCEACHGAGSKHARTMSSSDITEVATPRTLADFQDGHFAYGKPIACGECHTRDGEADHPTFISAYNAALTAAGKPTVPMGGRIAAKDGLIKHHEQYDELLGIDPATLDSTRGSSFMGAHGNCTTCHKDKHLTTVYRDESGDPSGVNASNPQCMVCHPNNDPNLRAGGMKSLDCIDCHMPKLAKSAVATTLGNGVVVGDVSSHIFTIDVSTTATQFDGSFSNPYITVNWACRICHGNNGLSDVSASDTFVFHNNK